MTFISDWLDESTLSLRDSPIRSIAEAEPGTIFGLENTRKYAIETALWTATEHDLPEIATRMHQLVSDIRTRLSAIEVNEALAASNLDFSSSVLPLGMHKTVLGFYISRELKNHIGDARLANLVVVSGAKFTKLSDLEAILKRGTVRWLISAGAFAMPLTKAQARFEGRDFNIGRAETDPSHPVFVTPETMRLATRIVERCYATGVDLTLPIDFVLDSGEVTTQIPKNRSQFDVGPRTRDLFRRKIAEYIDHSRRSPQAFTMFYNGAFGLFEDPRYGAGTQDFIQELRRMTAAGIRTYVGGGEGRLALAKFGSLADVTHAFTAGVTILKSMSDDHLYYLKAMYLQNMRLAADSQL